MLVLLSNKIQVVTMRLTCRFLLSFQRGMLAQIAARIRAHRAATGEVPGQDGDEGDEGEEGPRRIILSDDTCALQ